MSKISTTKVTKHNRAAQADSCALSLVVPVYNEQENIAGFVSRVAEVMQTMRPRTRYEIIFVNDGSTDASELAVVQAQLTHPQIRLINLSRNFGKDAALVAGLRHTRGAAVIPIDVDLQDPPELIPEMMKKWENGAKVVNAKRIDRTQDSWGKRITANAFYSVFNRLADHKIPHNVGDFRLLDRQVVDVLNGMEETARFNKALFSWVGFDAQEVTYERPARHRGETAWTYWRLWNFALDGILSASTTPLRIWSYVGFSLAVASFLYAMFIFLYTVILGADTPGYASTLIMILLFGGLNLFAVGILGEYVGRIYTEVRRRPLYVVRSTVNLEEAQTNG